LQKTPEPLGHFERFVRIWELRLSIDLVTFDAV